MQDRMRHDIIFGQFNDKRDRRILIPLMKTVIPWKLQVDLNMIRTFSKSVDEFVMVHALYLLGEADVVWSEVDGWSVVPLFFDLVFNVVCGCLGELQLRADKVGFFQAHLFGLGDHLGDGLEPTQFLLQKPHAASRIQTGRPKDTRQNQAIHQENGRSLEVERPG